MVRAAILMLLLTLQVGSAAAPELFRQQSFTSATFAEAVNHFVALGEDAALQELRGLALDASKDFTAHRGEWSTNERIGWMCRVLYDSKNKQPIRQPFFGGLGLPLLTMPLSSWPRFPVALSGSTYFVLSEGYMLGGLAEDPKNYMEHCRKTGVFRRTKVPVPTRAQALQDAAGLRKSKAWQDIKWKDSGPGWSYTMNEGLAWGFIQKQAGSIH